jgi:hypothetical protein
MISSTVRLQYRFSDGTPYYSVATFTERSQAELIRTFKRHCDRYNVQDYTLLDAGINPLSVLNVSSANLTEPETQSE